MLKTEDLYNALRDEIVQGRLNPGESLVERDICARFNTSRGYVRKVLSMLSAEGFVVLSRGKSATVAKVSYRETKDLYQLLGILEAKSTELATPNLSPSDIKELVQINRVMESCIYNKDRITARKVWQESNMKFHRKIAENTGNKEMELLVENIRWRTFDFKYVYFFEQKFDFFASNTIN